MVRNAVVLGGIVLLLCLGAGVVSGDTPVERPTDVATQAGNDTLVVDGDADGDSEYATIQAAVDNATDGDRVEVRSGTYRETVVIDENLTLTAPNGAVLEDPGGASTGIRIDDTTRAPVVDGFTLRGFDTGLDVDATGNWIARNVRVLNASSVGVDIVGDGDWRLVDSEIEGTSFIGITAIPAQGDWRIENVSVTGGGIFARAHGEWVIADTTVTDVGSSAISVNADGSWVIRDTVVRNASTGVQARDSAGQWTLPDTRIEDADTGISAVGSLNDWTVRDTTILNSTDGIDASDTTGDWTVRNARIEGASDWGVLARNTSGAWQVTRSTLTNDRDIDATGANLEGNATGNWWGNPSGPDADDCEGNVDCGQPLSSPPGSTGAPDTLVVDGDADGDSEYATIQAAIDRANPNERIEVRRGVYEKPNSGDSVYLRLQKNVTLVAPNGAVLVGPGGSGSAIQIGDVGVNRSLSPVVDGFTIRGFGDGVFAPGSGDWVVRNVSIANVSSFGVFAKGGDWRIANTVIRGTPIEGIAASGADGDWTVTNVTVGGGTRAGIGARDADGAWTITGTTVLGSEINAFRADGPWTVRDSVVRNTSIGIRATSAAGAWTVADTRIGNVSSGIQADTTSGDWTVRDVAITNSTFGIEAKASSGDWTVRNARIDGASRASVIASDARGAWQVTRSVLVSGREINARRASPTGDATGNWWGDPNGADPDDCVGNVDCGRPLSSPPSVGPDDPGAPPRGQNLPPVAELTVRPSTPSSIEPATLSGQASLDPNGDALTYRWDIGANGTIDATGPTVTRTFGVGQVSVALTVSDGVANATTRRTIRVRPPDERPNVTVVVERNGARQRPPVSLPLGSRAVLNASGSTAPSGRTVESITWTFPDGTTATDATALRRFDALGNRTIGVAVTDSAGVTTTANVTVEVTRPPAPVITNVSQPGDGIVPRVSGTVVDGFPRTWRAEVTPDATVANVTFAFPGGTRITDANGSDGWTAALDRAGGLSNLTDGRVTITATGVRGRTDRTVRTVDTFELPAWAGPYRVVDPADEPARVDGGYAITLPPVGFVLNSVDVGVELSASSALRVEHPLGTRQASFGGSTARSVEILVPVRPTVSVGGRRGQSLGVSGNATVADDRLVVESVTVTRNGTVAPVIAAGVGLPFVFEGELRSELRLSKSTRLRLDTRPSVAVEGGSYALSVTLIPAQASVSALLGPFSLGTVSVRGQISATGTATVDRRGVDGTLTTDGKIVGTANVLFFRYREEIEPAAVIPLGNRTGNATVAVASTRSRTVTVRDERSDVSPGAAFGTGTRGAVRSQSTGGVTPLTTDRLADRAPAVAEGDGVTAVWTRQRQNHTLANGSELALAAYDNGTWTSPVTLTDDMRYDAAPAVAAADGQRAVAWARANESLRLGRLDGPGNVARHFDLYIGTAAGGQVVNRTRLTDDAVADLAPTVAGTGDAWLVAWLQDTDGNLTTGRDRRARYAVLGPDLGTVRAGGTLSGVTAVDTAIDGGRLVLAARNATAGTVVRRTFAADGSLDRRRLYAAPNASDVAVDAESLAWVGDGLLRVARGGTTRTVGNAAVGVRDLQAFRTNDSSVLVYRAARNGSGDTGLFYQIRGDAADGWTAPAEFETGGLRVAGGSLTARGDALVGAFTSSPNATVNADVFGARQPFAPPDLTVDAEVRDATPAAATVAVTVRNDGEQQADATTVRLETPNGRTPNATVGPLAPGGTATRTITVDRPRAGAASVSVASVTDERATANNAEAVPFRANLTITRVTDRLTDDRGRLVVPVTVRNDGPFPVRNASYRLSVGGRTVSGVVPGIGVSRTWQVTPAVDASAVGTGTRATVTVGGTQVGVGTDRRQIRVRRPDVGVGSPLGYAANGSGYGRVALVPVFSGDTGGRAAAVTVETDGGTVTYRVPVAAARSGSDSVSRRVALGLPPTAAGGTVRLSTAPTVGTDTAPGDDAAVGTVPAGASASVATPALAEVTARSVSGNRTAVGVVVGNPGTVPLGALVRVANGRANETLTAVVAPGERARLQATLPASGPVTVRTIDEVRQASPTAGPPPVAGAPPTDPDGDGVYEDVNGDGAADRTDALAYYRSRDSAAVRTAPGAFDFDGDGVAGTVSDALALYEEVN